MPTTPSPEPKKRSVKAIQRLISSVYLGRRLTEKEIVEAQAEVQELVEGDKDLDHYKKFS